MTYNITKIFSNGNYNERVVCTHHKIVARQAAEKFGVIVKIGEASSVRKFYLNGEFIGMINCHPSNNGKFYATSSTGYVNGEGHSHLFPTFIGALRFALNAVKATHAELEQLV